MIGGGGVRISETAELFLSVWASIIALRPSLLHTHWVQTKSAEGTIRVVRQISLYVFVLKCLTQHINSFNFTFCLGCAHTLNTVNDNELCSIIECLFLYLEAYSAIIRFIAVHFLSHVDIWNFDLQFTNAG
jgi:hypothetical protein